MTNKFPFLYIFLLAFNFITGQRELPIVIANEKIKPLKNLQSISFQSALESEIKKNQEWQKLIDEKKMAIGVVDLRDATRVKFASINGNHMMYAASLPKIAILLTAMEALENRELEDTPEIREDLKLMISKSDNQASTRMIDRLGYKKLESVMTDSRYGFYDEDNGGGIWVGKRYGGGGATNREPLKNLSHAATVNQVCRYYYLLANGKLVNQKRSKEMLNIMEKPALHHKFVNTLEKIAPKARLFRKSGSWKTYHSDSILVWDDHGDRRYILVALIDNSNGEQIIRSLVKPIEKVMKTTYLSQKL